MPYRDTHKSNDANCFADRELFVGSLQTAVIMKASLARGGLSVLIQFHHIKHHHLSAQYSKAREGLAEWDPYLFYGGRHYLK